MTSSDLIVCNWGGALDHDGAFGDMAWAEPEHDRQQVNTAGATLIADPVDVGNQYFWKFHEALAIMNNWRAAHSYPLNTFQVNLRRTSRQVDVGALVAQRIKRLASIELKLQRFPTMKLSQMQDIGGCRAVVKTVASVRELVSLYEKSRIKHELATLDDYIEAPRDSGYRGVHLTYKYFSDKPAKAVYNGLKIEMQLRSRQQHAWATAVETVGTFVHQALKSSIGEENWLRFFALMATAIAMREKCHLVPGTPTNRSELINELSHYVRTLNIEARLTAYNQTLQILQQPVVANAHFYLLRLDTEANQITISGFPARDLEEASSQYAEAEKRVKGKRGTDAVLVSVDSLASLRRAYPNYFADTRAFLQLMNQALRRP